MNELLKWVLAWPLVAILFLFAIYLVSRIVFIGYFKTKDEFQNRNVTTTTTTIIKKEEKKNAAEKVRVQEEKR
jgi:hypothetical protein